MVSQGKDKGKGNSDGSHNYKKLFTCQQRCGLFVPFSQITPVALSSASSPPTAEPGAQPSAEELCVGDRVTYFTNSEPRHGMVMDIQERDGQTMVRISTVSSLPNHSSTVTVSARLQASRCVSLVCHDCWQDTDENGKMGGEMEVSLNELAKGEVPSGRSITNPTTCCVCGIYLVNNATESEQTCHCRARELGGPPTPGARRGFVQ